MTTEQRAGLVIGRDLVAPAVAAIKLRRQQAAERPTEAESFALVQARELNALVDGGVQDLFVGAAQSLREEYPDVRVRAAKPTGRRRDNMAIVLEFDHHRTKEGLQSFRRMFAIPNPRDELREIEFAIGEGSLLSPERNLIARKEDANGEVEKQFYFSYDDGEFMLSLAAKMIASRIEMSTGWNLVTIDNGGRSWLQRQRALRGALRGALRVKPNDIERPFIEVEIPPLSSGPAPVVAAS
ncbi:MAG: hypothetical protein HYV38_00035 [Candidatus Levybacteria bacterium]|nr:hypothetical protein [Candidatus Levybacteria bacterium]MBI2420460.1 hypothetical protein [Candidatus Levybacteria bacterium]MBI4097543.1 hypothetical protein [Candidatus Levybacteria bacterium]